MSTTIKSVQFGASMWVPRPEPPRAVMPIIVTVAGFDTSDLVMDLATWLSAQLSWAELYRDIVLRWIRSRLKRSILTPWPRVSARCWSRSGRTRGR